MPATGTPTFYFGYGSNLWKDQMVKRCPTSEYLGIARLPHFRWIINERGYANVVADSGSGLDHECWGLIYQLQPNDEARLDINEGVPEAYTKEYQAVDFWPVSKGKAADATRDPSRRMDMLVYIDRRRTEPDQPKQEYIFRMNKGIQNALEDGVPMSYVKDVLRKYIPVDSGDDETERLARKQAMLFEDEKE